MPIADDYRNKEAEDLLAAAQNQAAKLVSDAQGVAETCLNEAKQQVDIIKQEAREQGHQSGYQAGYEKGLLAGRETIQAEMTAKIQETADQVNVLLTAAQTAADNTIKGSERLIIDIALAVAQKILAREVRENPATILAIVKTALEKVQGQEKIMIKVNPADLPMVLAVKDELQAATGEEKVLTFAADTSVDRGGCLLDTSYGVVNAKIGPQMAILKKTIVDYYNEHT